MKSLALGCARRPDLDGVSNQFLVDLDRVDHNAVSDFNIGLLDWLLRLGEGCLASNPTSTIFAAMVFTVTDVSEILVTVPVTCSSPP